MSHPSSYTGRYVPEIPRDQQGRPWWQVCGIEEFTRRVVGMRDSELWALNAEVKGSAALIQSQLEARGRSDEDWWRKAKSALGFIAEKRGILKSEVTKRKAHQPPPDLSKRREREKVQASRKEERRKRLMAIRHRAEEGDPAGAIVDLIDYFLEP